MNRLAEAIQIEFFNNFETFHRHEKLENGEQVTETKEIRIEQLPNVHKPTGAVLPEKRDGEMPPNFQCPILTDFVMLKNSPCNPTEFLHDVEVFTTLSALRSVICQWTNFWGPKSQFFKKNLHFCHMDAQGRVFLNTGTNYTVPYERSTSFLNRFTILEHGQTWDQFIATSYSGLAKIRLKNGVRVAFTYKMYAQFQNEPVDIIIRSASSFQREIDFHFLNCLLTRKKLWRYDYFRTRGQISTKFQESVGVDELWNRMSAGKQAKILNCFENRLPEFLIDVAFGIESEEVVNIIDSVNSPVVRLTEKPILDSLY
ncbi:uncharacterized protein CELE_Y66D12A.3 [Caenorhabditis elegans]|uniref:Uncharacterized protein n=1 Tax=Caenorhabditis elegans TaxID=6239 RepID=Q95Q09_CAEEL|nr:Uncharacterized protein CELE_Y66D12A.3 [Caenorhabditis elegans]CAC70128.1 Uncharacterized protein CELE_Y66D12A.3 [Caenorhabditis elegans]|eukprot:NP_499499.1 Uncharacterized protein CELE_Y66D12A.3 [Caenorhabditis elegans]